MTHRSITPIRVRPNEPLPLCVQHWWEEFDDEPLFNYVEWLEANETVPQDHEVLPSSLGGSL